MLIEKDNYSDTDMVKIFLGSGDYYSNSEDGLYMSAPEPAYESFLKTGNDIQEDHEIAKEIIYELSQEFPNLKLTNNLKVVGSFHELFQSFSIDIDANSITKECEARGDIEIELLLHQIAATVNDFLKSQSVQ